MEKQSAYQKLKAENIALKKDIYLIIRKGNTMEGMEVKAKWNIKFYFEDLAWFATPTIINK